MRKTVLGGIAIATLLVLVSASTPFELRLASAEEPGEPLEVRLTLRAPAPGPYELHVYQTDASGRYTRERAMDEPHARLNGRVVLPSLPAVVRLRTIRPGGYPRALVLGGRERHIPAHVHLDVLHGGRVIEHWQMVFSDDTLLTDRYWRDWVADLHQPVVTLTRRDGGWRGEAALEVRMRGAR